MDTDRNLLFGILALQADFITQSQFVEACGVWASRKDQALAWLLVERGWLSSDDRLTVERFLQRKLKRYDGDVTATLAAVADAEIRHTLAGLPDADVQQSLGAAPQLVRTIAYTPESHGRYTITRLHATGGIGQVWVARDHALGREVALKDLRPEASAHSNLSARFLEEAQITGQLEHPNIVPVYELARQAEDDRLYYTMRFVRGQTLGEKIKAFHQRRKDNQNLPLEFRDLLTAFTSICHAVTYAHSRGVIHRDLKPQNVILGNFGEVVLLDWGLAKLVNQPDDGSEAPPLVLERSGAGEPTVQGQVLGTPAYMAPEQAEGRLEQIDSRTDIYGLGAILYELLTGKPPFTGASTAAVLESVRTARPDEPHRAWPQVPRPLVAICEKAMAKRPADRYASVNELRLDVQHWLGNELVSAYPESWAEQSARWQRRHPALTAAVLSLLAALVIMLVAGLVALDRSRQALDEQRLQAEKNFQNSLTIMQQSMESLERQVEQSPVPGMQPFQKELLKKQLEQYERYSPEYRNELKVQASAAQSYYRLGKVCQDVGTLPEAIDSLTRARSLYLSFTAPENNPRLYSDRIARCHFSIGQVHLAMGEPGAALEPLKASVALTGDDFNLNQETNRKWQTAGKASGADLPPTTTASLWTSRELLAWELTYLAIAESRTGQTEEALRSFGRAREHFQELIKDEYRSVETYPYFPNGDGFCLLHQAQLEQSLGRAARATASYGSALAQLRRAIALQQEKPRPNNKALAQFQGVLALALTDQGTHLAERNRPAEASAALDEAVALLNGLYRDNPASLLHQWRLASAEAERGFLHVQAGQRDSAEAEFRRALERVELLASGPPLRPGETPTGEARGNPEVKAGRAAAVRALGGLAIVQKQRGQTAEALLSVRRALEIGATTAANSPLSRLHLAAAQSLASDGTEDRAEQERFRNQAIESLRQVIQLGFRNRSALEGHPGFASLRERPEFQQLLADLN